jgi:hypothetical protein
MFAVPQRPCDTHPKGNSQISRMNNHFPFGIKPSSLRSSDSPHEIESVMKINVSREDKSLQRHQQTDRSVEIHRY